MRFLTSGQGWPYLLVPFIPIAIVLDVAGASATAVFFSSALGVIPTAAMMGRATEELAERSGNVIGGLLNVTFGNAPELIIALFALGKGLHEVVKASLVDSILGNILLVMGAAMLAGGRGRDAGDAGRLPAGRPRLAAKAPRRDPPLRLEGGAPVARDRGDPDPGLRR